MQSRHVIYGHGKMNLKSVSLGCRGMMGVGVLIIFIAVILVAAVSAIVLINSSASLQSRGVQVGKDAEEGVASGIEVMSIDGLYGNTGHDLEHFEMDVRLAAGSEPVKFNRTLIFFDTETTTQGLNYNSVANTFPSDTTTFNVEYIFSDSNHEDGYLKRGEVARVRFNHYHAADAADADGGLQEFKEARLKIIPPLGTASIVQFKTAVITVKRENVWPG